MEKDAPGPKMIFFNIGWMIHYGGAVSEDKTLGGHGHLKTSSHGAESFNFVPVAGRYYGYRPTGEKGVNIRRLGAKASDESIDGVTVVWMARRPGSKDTVIVGWYRNATVYRTVQTVPEGGPAREWPQYMVEAAAKDCRLLPLTARNFQVLSSHRLPGSFGQAPTFYDTSNLYRDKVENYINNVDENIKSAKKRRGKGGGRNLNPEQRRFIEETAVKHATAYFESDEGGGWSVESVERFARGWDLECQRDGEFLYVEVKGCGGNEVRAELTPNEWSQMQHKDYRSRYIIYVVTDCLSATPLASIFWHRKGELWQTLDGRNLQIEECVAAKIKCLD